ncbi:PREDICTED: sialic acid-binding Ig-like lectin 12-like [Elephantulus edwardii]|uniref:sialic acid-binding Ig-like lectin 12-like n=1 Tax=Elephantulus edwardii TaxID=28737 RepID=UPI0003F0D2CF|nr:PREDICTED: sialic acid-binding Ig-like lectin 12-like [Elephantulus edwardii]
MEGAGATDIIVGSGSWRHQHPLQTSLPPDLPVPPEAGPNSADEEGLHYAVLNFKKLKQLEREDSDTEYSEIKIHTQKPRDASPGDAAVPALGARTQHSEFQLQIQSPVTVEEGLCIQVPCTVFYPHHSWNRSTPAYGYWFWGNAHASQGDPVATNNPQRRVQARTQGRFHLLGDPHIYDCSLEIGEAQKGDAGTYFFRIERGPVVRFNFLDNQLSVRVTALTQTPNIHVEGTLKSGHPRNITCTIPWTCKMVTPPTFSWTGVALTSLDPKTLHSPVLTLTPESHHHGTKLTCQVTLSGGGVAMESTIQLNVSYVPKNLTIRAFQGNSTVPEILANATSLHVLEGQSLRLVCNADSNLPAKLSWSRGSLTLSPSQSLNSAILELPYVVSGDGGEFTCRAQHLSDSSHISLNLVVKGEYGQGTCILR